MIYRKYKNGTKLSRLGMGIMRLPIQDGDDTKINYEKAKAMIDQCMAAGINYYDTAYIYHGGKSEEFIGKALAEYPRESYHVADKFNLQANPNYKAQFAEQLHGGIDSVWKNKARKGNEKKREPIKSLYHGLFTRREINGKLYFYTACQTLDKIFCELHK